MNQSAVGELSEKIDREQMMVCREIASARWAAAAAKAMSSSSAVVACFRLLGYPLGSQRGSSR
jgi:hypothetical protein